MKDWNLFGELCGRIKSSRKDVKKTRGCFYVTPFFYLLNLLQLFGDGKGNYQDLNEM